MAASGRTTDDILRFANLLGALGTESRLRILRLLLHAHPHGLTVGEIQSELDIPGSTLSHHLDKLKSEGLVKVRRESTFLWYSTNTDALKDLLSFLLSECCTRSNALTPAELLAFDGGKKSARGRQAS